MKARLRGFARALRRRLSNLAWVLGGGSTLALLGGGFVRQMLPFEQVPDLLAYGSLAAIAASLLASAAAFGLGLSSFRSREVTASAGDGGVWVQRGTRTTEYSYEELGGMLRHKGRVWLVRGNGNLLELAFDDESEASAFEETVRGRIGVRRVELVPHPTLLTAPIVIVALFAGLVVMSNMASRWLAPNIHVPAMFLGVAVAAAGGLAAALRGTSFVLGQDGIRLGRKFIAFEAMQSVEVVGKRVSVVDKNGKRTRARVHMPAQLAEALNAELATRMTSDGAGQEGALEREDGEELHAWLERIIKAMRDTSFRRPGMQKERVRVAALHPKAPLRVRVAALAGLMEEDPALAQELLEVSADPRLEKVAKAAQGSAEGWRRALERLEKQGALE